MSKKKYNITLEHPEDESCLCVQRELSEYEYSLIKSIVDEFAQQRSEIYEQDCFVDVEMNITLDETEEFDRRQTISDEQIEKSKKEYEEMLNRIHQRTEHFFDSIIEDFVLDETKKQEIRADVSTLTLSDELDYSDVIANLNK